MSYASEQIDRSHPARYTLLSVSPSLCRSMATCGDGGGSPLREMANNNAAGGGASIQRFAVRNDFPMVNSKDLVAFFNSGTDDGPLPDAVLSFFNGEKVRARSFMTTYILIIRNNNGKWLGHNNECRDLSFGNVVENLDRAVTLAELAKVIYNVFKRCDYKSDQAVEGNYMLH